MDALNDSITKLGLNDKIKIILFNHSINTIKDLWKLKRADLKNLSLNNDEINQIIIKMQLKGIDLNYKIY